MPSSLQQNVKAFVCSHPSLYRWGVTLLRREKLNLLADRGTGIVIDGYPRSANTRAIVAFQLAGNHTVRIAHHTHAPATILTGCSYNIPTVVLVRDPIDAVTSAAIFTGRAPSQLLREWIWFYRVCWPARSSFVVAPFELVVSDFGKVIRKVNKVWNTSYKTLVVNRQNEARIQERVELIARRSGQGERQVARPSRIRDEYKATVQSMVSGHVGLLNEARHILERYIEVAAQQHLQVD